MLNEKEKTLKSTTCVTYLGFFNSRIVPYFDKKLITELKPIDVKEWYKTFTDLSTLKGCETLLKAAVENAILCERISATPFVLKKPSLKSDYKVIPFTLEEVMVLITSAKSNSFGNFLAISFFTGIRPGELIALSWEDIDFNRNTISINKTMTNGFLQKPKTKNSLAEIDLPIEALKYFKNEQLKTGLRKNIFYSEQRNKIYKSSDSLNIKFKKLLKSLDMVIRNIYQTRHTFASLKLIAGEKLEWVSFMLRHKNPRITLERYYRYIPKEDSKRVVLDIENAQNRHTS